MERLLDSTIRTDRMVGGAAGEVDKRRVWKVIWSLTIVPCHPEAPNSIYIITHRWYRGWSEGGGRASLLSFIKV